MIVDGKIWRKIFFVIGIVEFFTVIYSTIKASHNSGPTFL